MPSQPPHDPKKPQPPHPVPSTHAPHSPKHAPHHPAQRKAVQSTHTATAKVAQLNPYRLDAEQHLRKLRSLTPQKDCDVIVSKQVKSGHPVDKDRHPAIHALGLAKWHHKSVALDPKASVPVPVDLLADDDRPSVDNMIQVIKNSKVSHIEIAHAPFWNTHADHAFDNILLVIEALRSLMKVTVTIHFSIHVKMKGSSDDGDLYGATIKSRAGQVNTKLIEVYGTDENIFFVMCPSIEDYLDDSKTSKDDQKAADRFTQMAGLIAAELNWDKSDRVSLRRSGPNHKMLSAIKVTKKKTDGTECDSKTFPLQTEAHGPLKDAEEGNYYVCSNDGYLLFYEATESAQSLILKKPIAPNTPINAIKAATHAALPKGTTHTRHVHIYSFWRPMYNLWYVSKNGIRVYDEKGDRTWHSTLQDDKNLDETFASHHGDAVPAFDVNEMSALTEFLSYYE